MRVESLAGTVIAGRYKLLELTRRSLTGDTYLAQHPMLGVRFDVKILGEELSEDPAARQRIQHEAEVVSRLNHPNIIGVHDFGETEDGRFYMVMEHAAGHSLRRELRRLDPEIMGLRRALLLLKQLCHALTVAHDAGVVHRGICPANLILSRSASGEEQIKILDFGLSKVVPDDGEGSLTRNRQILGDPRYMAPEHLTGAPVDSRADIFSVGVVAYQLLTGDIPFPGRQPIQVVAAHSRGPAPDLSSMRPADLPEVPGNLERVFMRSLAINREDRPRHVADLVEAILMALPRVPDERSEGRRHTITRVSGSAAEARAWADKTREAPQQGAARAVESPASAKSPPAAAPVPQPAAAPGVSGSAAAPPAARPAPAAAPGVSGSAAVPPAAAAAPVPPPAAPRPASAASPAPPPPVPEAAKERAARKSLAASGSIEVGGESSRGAVSSAQGEAADVMELDAFDVDMEEDFDSDGATVGEQSLDELKEEVWNNVNRRAAELVKLLEQHGVCSEELSGYLKAIDRLEEQETATETEIAVLKDRLDETERAARHKTAPLRDAILSLRQARSRLASAGEEPGGTVVASLDAQILELEAKLGDATAALEAKQQEVAEYLEKRRQELEGIQQKVGENQLIMLQLLRFHKRQDFPPDVQQAYAALEELLAAVQMDER